MATLIVKEINDAVTMTSLELVSFINSIRAQEPGYVELRHDSFLQKVKTVLAEGVQKFLDSYGSAQGKVMPMYRFPKREATLMTMSYSHKITAQIYDRMEEPEKQVNYAQNQHQNTVLGYYYCIFRA